MNKCNPLNIFNQNYSWADYNTFKAHLRLPYWLLKIIFNNFRSLNEVPTKIPYIVEKYNAHLWAKMTDKEINQIKYKLAGIPTVYLDADLIPSAKGDSLRAFCAIKKNIQGFTGKGRMLYFHSLFQEQATIAAAMLMKQAVDDKISCYMVDFPTYLAEIYEFSNGKSELMKKTNQAELLVVWAIGTEWKTDFTESHLEALIKMRKFNKKTTILVSSLNEKEFNSRYKMGLSATILEFTDAKMKETLSQLIEELETSAKTY